MIAASLTFIILFAIWEAYEDQRDIKRGKDIDHSYLWEEKFRARLNELAENKR